MTISEAADILKNMYGTAPAGEQVAQVHLFGIRYASELEGMPLAEIVMRAGISQSYGTEIRKGIHLARYVVLKP